MMALRLATTPSLLSLHNRWATQLALPLAVAGAVTKPLHSRAAVSIRRKASRLPLVTAALPPLDLTEESVKQVLVDARTEFEQIFDSSVGITGKAELAELDGPFVKISLRGRFWHKRSTVLERLGTYLKNRIPEILEVEIEDEKQLDDSPENF